MLSKSKDSYGRFGGGQVGESPTLYKWRVLGGTGKDKQQSTIWTRERTKATSLPPRSGAIFVSIGPIPVDIHLVMQ